jgi:hypothetical protein
MVCLRNISVDTLHKGDTKDNNNKNNAIEILKNLGFLMFTLNVETVLPLDGLRWQLPSAVMLV